MARANLTAARLRELFSYDPDAGVFFRRPESATGVNARYLNRPAGSLSKALGYIIMGVDNETYLAHRLAWLYVFGKWPEQSIDHIDGNRANNRIANLRDVSAAVNGQNQRRPPKSKATQAPLGAHWKKHAKLWASNIQVNGTLVYLGYYKTAEQAHEAYVKAKRQLHPGCTI